MSLCCNNKYLLSPQSFFQSSLQHIHCYNVVCTFNGPACPFTLYIAIPLFLSSNLYNSYFHSCNLTTLNTYIGLYISMGPTCTLCLCSLLSPPSLILPLCLPALIPPLFHYNSYHFGLEFVNVGSSLGPSSYSSSPPCKEVILYVCCCVVFFLSVERRIPPRNPAMKFTCISCKNRQKLHIFSLFSPTL